MTVIRAAVETVEWTERLDRALDRLDWQWLSDTHPELATEVEVAVGVGASPVEIRRQVMRRTGRMELATRCEHAAAAVMEMGG